MYLKVSVFALSMSSCLVHAGVNTVLKSVSVERQSLVATPNVSISNSEVVLLDAEFKSEISETPLDNSEPLVDEGHKESNVTVTNDIPLVQENESVLINGRFSQFPDGRVEFKLIKGLLKPQIEELLMNHERVDGLDDIEWMASNNFMWPNDFTLKADSLEDALSRLLFPYKLEAVFKVNVIEINSI